MTYAKLREDLFDEATGEIEGFVQIWIVSSIRCAITKGSAKPIRKQDRFDPKAVYEVAQPEAFGNGLNSREGFNMLLFGKWGIYLANSLDFDFVEDPSLPLTTAHDNLSHNPTTKERTS